MGNRSYSGPVLGDVVGAAAWGSKIYTLRGGLDGCEQMCTLHAVVVLCVCPWTLAKFGESFHAYTRFIRWGGSNSTIY